MTRDNAILAEFEFVVDLDLAMYKLIRDNYSTSEYVDKKIISENDERNIIFKLLSRKHKNPLEVIMPDVDSGDLYNEIMEEHYEELLSYAMAYDTFGLLVTMLNNASSLAIRILCKSKLEQSFIHMLNPKVATILEPNKKSLSLSDYTILYVKYITNLFEYGNIEGKHIYFAAAKFNMEEDSDMVSRNCCLFGDVNELHLMDLYTKVKYRFPKKKGEEDENLF